MKLNERLDSMPLSRFHWSLVTASGLGWLFDAFDSGLVSFVLAVLAKEWLLTPAQVGRIGSMGLVGMFAGAALVGLLADRFGRKLLFQSTLIVFSAATGLCGLATGYGALLAMRFLVGFGLGGELPVASTLVSEFAPKAHRGKMIVILESFWALGWALAALVAFLLIPRWGWRMAFFLGAAPALYVLYLRRFVPESPRFLEASGRFEDAALVVREVERACGQPPSPLEPSQEKPAERPGMRALWSPAMSRRTAMLWILWFAMIYSYYGIFIWLPSLLVAAGFPLVKSFSYVLIITAAQVPGYFSAAWLVDRWGRKPTLVAYLAGCVVSSFVFGKVGSPAGVILWGCLISFFNLGAWGVVYTYTPELYPTALRATGAGWASGLGRVGGILAPLVVGWIMGTFPGRQDLVFAQFAFVVFIGLLAVAFLGQETKGRSLEDIAA
ncbi:MAG: MFS transporter [Elusimicrobia bacterium]|nr:MFS transporter [Elusimicrobiota bacterium]